MIHFDFGIYPLMGLLVGGALYAVFRFLLRFRYRPKANKRLIVIFLLFTLAFTFVSLTRYDDQPLAIDPTTGVPYPGQGKSASILDIQELAEEKGDDPSSFTDKEKDISAVSHSHDAKKGDLEEGKTIGTKFTNFNSHSSWNVLFFDGTTLLFWCWLAGAVLVLLHFLFQLLLLERQRRNSCFLRREDGVFIYETSGPAPCSFGKSLFFPINMRNEDECFVYAHERQHVAHHHFHELCVMQVFMVPLWFNPFVWMFFSELKLQQEYEVDEAVLDQGFDRQAYQMSLLRACSTNSRWVILQSGYGFSSLRKRILFMNKPVGQTAGRRWLAAGVVACMSVISLSAAFSYQRHVRTSPNPLEGCWTMDWIRTKGSVMKNVPPFKQYMFYSNNTIMHFSYSSRNGMNIRFNMSALGYSFRDGINYDFRGDTASSKFIDDRTMMVIWRKDSAMTTLVGGPEIEEQWTRCEPDPELKQLFNVIYQTPDVSSDRLEGCWVSMDDDQPERVSEFCFFSHGVFMRLWYHHSQQKYFERGANGLCGLYDYKDGKLMTGLGDTISLHQTDKNHFHLGETVINGYYSSTDGGKNYVYKCDTVVTQTHFRRCQMPLELRRVMSAPVLCE